MNLGNEVVLAMHATQDDKKDKQRLTANNGETENNSILNNQSEKALKFQQLLIKQ